MRLSSNQIFSQRMDNITSSQSKWMTEGNKISSGRRVEKPSDDPMAASQAVMVKQSESRNQQYATARGFAKNSMSLQMSLASQMVNITTKIQETLVAAGNDATLSDEDRSSLADQLQGLKDQLVGIGNTKDGVGRYIFAGFQSDKPPFVADATGKITYQGGDKQITQKVDSNIEMVTNFTGIETLQSSGSKGTAPDIFEALDGAITALREPLTGKPQADRDAALEKIDAANRVNRATLNNISSVEAKLGLQLQELDNLDDLGADTSLRNAKRLSELRDLDWTQAISDYYQEESVLQASYKVFNDMKDMSMFKMYR
ncbi:flagellar hook-associated protein FlgL [Proteus cibarius]|uniref:Flagellar hook-associated protein FlgL n=2 Tax=Proteus TaxID=583 RepID=A0A6G6SUW1_9GAMM|nr:MULTISPECIES: flagellar hook-associated protein FlgL [Proteus]MBI6512940.1 flagellar hook-associated protein FlgL [Proteus sp. PR00174]MCM2366714.1 flagellar hook-associated protein FlgL [Proteus sp. FZP2095]NBN46573.1 flagellar hook-filament junction protein FlgL [Proteus sp. G2626]NBN60347.1 flagellar hook-filament junction protein FlgL [Proteus sp. G2639]NBN75242.1 flagellar hook-filament junction protein FlgL [Proteus sp. G2615]NBN86824.1 flagellar hook-filament junction protein FlgL [